MDRQRIRPGGAAPAPAPARLLLHQRAVAAVHPREPPPSTSLLPSLRLPSPRPSLPLPPFTREPPSPPPPFFTTHSTSASMSASDTSASPMATTRIMNSRSCNQCHQYNQSMQSCKPFKANGPMRSMTSRPCSGLQRFEASTAGATHQPVPLHRPAERRSWQPNATRRARCAPVPPQPLDLRSSLINGRVHSTSHSKTHSVAHSTASHCPARHTLQMSSLRGSVAGSSRCPGSTAASAASFLRRGGERSGPYNGCGPRLVSTDQHGVQAAREDSSLAALAEAPCAARNAASQRAPTALLPRGTQHADVGGGRPIGRRSSRWPICAESPPPSAPAWQPAWGATRSVGAL